MVSIIQKTLKDFKEDEKNPNNDLVAQIKRQKTALSSA